MDANQKVCLLFHYSSLCSQLLSPKVEFCGYRYIVPSLLWQPLVLSFGSRLANLIIIHYSAPHPSENVINVRIQMFGKLFSISSQLVPTLPMGR